jgi:hypothetical protein
MRSTADKRHETAGIACWSKLEITPPSISNHPLAAGSDLDSYRGCVCRKSDSAILVMKVAEDRLERDNADALNHAMERGILVQRAMHPASSTAMRSTADKRHETAGIACWLMAQGLRQLKMVTDWPEGTPGLDTGAVRFAQTTDIATGGRIKVEVFPSGALVRPFETFDAVGAGVADSPRCWRSQIGVE